MREFNYSKIKEQKWDLEVLSLIAGIYKYAGKQELYLKQRPDELEKLVEIAKVQSTQPIPVSDSWSRRKRRLKTGMKRKLPGTGMS